MLKDVNAVGIAFENFPRIVRAAVIDDDQFDVGVCLVDYALHGLGDVFSPVVAGNNNRDFWAHLNDPILLIISWLVEAP